MPFGGPGADPADPKRTEAIPERDRRKILQ